MTDLTFVVPDPRHAALTLGWRMSPRVTRFMFTDPNHGLDQQRAWLEASRAREDYRHWLVLDRGRPFGLVNLQAIDWKARRAASGFYIGEDWARPLGAFVLPYLYNHGFLDLGFEAMTAEVMEGNEEVLRLHALHGYREDGFDAGRVVKNGVEYGVHRLMLEREAWLGQPRMQRYRTAFPWP
jgi:RimJ/RimL family protein N-acetyltransferase